MGDKDNMAGEVPVGGVVEFGCWKKEESVTKEGFVAGMEEACV